MENELWPLFLIHSIEEIVVELAFINELAYYGSEVLKLWS